MVTYLVPKIRNLNIGEDSSQFTLNVGDEAVINIPTAFDRLRVIERLQIPVGADKFDSGESSYRFEHQTETYLVL